MSRAAATGTLWRVGELGTDAYGGGPADVAGFA